MTDQRKAENCVGAFKPLADAAAKAMARLRGGDRGGTIAGALGLAKDQQCDCWQCPTGEKCLACRATALFDRPPGVPAEHLCVYRDGDQWCAVLPDFVNLQESPAGFGDTPDRAVEALIQDEAFYGHG